MTVPWSCPSCWGAFLTGAIVGLMAGLALLVAYTVRIERVSDWSQQHTKGDE